MVAACLEAVRSQRPLVHCMTNYVSINDCANGLLAIGASPVMAEAIEEVAIIASRADALVLNLGMLTGDKLECMKQAGLAAQSVGIPIILDPVGVGASPFRLESANTLVELVKPTVIRGNLGELKALCHGGQSERGVDSTEEEGESSRWVRQLASQSGAIVALSGQMDVISDGRQVIQLDNGHPWLKSVTGMGCVLSALMGALCGANKEEMKKVHTLEPVVAAMALLGVAGEWAYQRCEKQGGGLGSFRMYLMDGLSLLDGQKIEKEIRYA